MMALVLIMGMSQCKKNEQNANNNNGVKPIITVYCDNSSKIHFGHEIDGQVPVMWNASDIVYVGVNGKCIGYLNSEGASVNYETGLSQAQFNGYPGTFDIDALHVGDVMEFFTLGGVEQPLAFGDEQLVFNYNDQSHNPAVISHGYADKGYTGEIEGTAYNIIEFYNSNILVKFSVNKYTTKQITICGVKDQSIVNFNGEIGTSDHTGDIITYTNEVGNNNIRYAVIPRNQGAMTGQVKVDGAVAGTFVIPNSSYPNGLIKGTITLD